MSTIMKKPLIETIMDNLDGDTLVKLHSDIDSDTGYSEYNLLERYLPQLGEGETSLAVRATLITNGETLVGSYIKYSSLGETHSYLLNYGRGVHKVYIYEINEEKRTTYLVGECLGVSELRRVIVDKLIEQGTNDIPIHKNENGSYVFNDGIEVKSNGDVAIGKNLEVAGKVFTLNGKQWGIMPVIKINVSGNYAEEGFILSDALPSVEEGLINVSGIWYSADRNDVIGLCPAKTNFPKKSNKTRIENGILYVDVTDIDTLLELFPYIVTQLDLPDLSELQSQLYRHNIMLNGFYILMYDSTSNLKVKSVDDLRIIMKIPSKYNREILPVCTTDATAIATLVVTADLCRIDGIDVTTVSDVVTAL